MKCKLCDAEIEKYNSRLNRLEIRSDLAVDVCQGCVDKFAKWQSSIMVDLFPTKALKKKREESHDRNR